MSSLNFLSASGIFHFCVVIFSTFFIIGGNTLTILAILKKPKLATPSNQFIIGLALADLLVGFSLPYCSVTFFVTVETTKSFWSFFTRCLLSIIPLLTSCFASFLHLIAIAVDRYIALAYPLKHKVHMTKGRAWRLIAVLWLIAALFASVPIFWNRNLDETIISCMVRTMTKSYFTHVLVPLYIIFIIILCIMYIGIYRYAAANTTDAMKPILVISMVIGCFLVCWTPFVICLFYKLNLQSHINATIYSISYILVTSNSFMNPLIYAWKNKEFRNTFADFLRCRKFSSDNQPAHQGHQNNAFNAEISEIPVDVLPTEQ